MKMEIGVISGTSAVIFRMTAEQWAVFQKFQRIQVDVIAMIDSGVFDFRNGKAIIHRDREGKLRGIELDVWKWKV